MKLKKNDFYRPEDLKMRRTRSSVGKTAMKSKRKVVFRYLLAVERGWVTKTPLSA